MNSRFSKAGPNADVGKLRIRRVPGMRADVTFTLSDAICAPIVGISEEVNIYSMYLYMYSVYFLLFLYTDSALFDVIRCDNLNSN